jgi:hypothetical protein
MAVTMMSQDFSSRSFKNYGEPSSPCAISELGRRDEPEVIEFLSVRPLHTVFMAGLVRDNGVVSPGNRGSFYASRNYSGQLEAVALIGHERDRNANRREGSTPNPPNLARSE